MKVLQIKYFLPMLCNWYPASRLAGYQFLKSPAWYKINYMFFILIVCATFIIINNICSHTNRSNLIDNRQVTWQKSIISKFIWNNLFHACAHKICAKSCLQYCWWLMKNISSLKTMKCKYFINSQFWANCYVMYPSVDCLQLKS